MSPVLPRSVRTHGAVSPVSYLLTRLQALLRNRGDPCPTSRVLPVAHWPAAVPSALH